MLLGHLLHHLHYLTRAHHLKHICPEITTAHTAFWLQIRELDFEVGFSREAEIQPRTHLVQCEARSSCATHAWLQTGFLPWALLYIRWFAVASPKAVSNHISPMVRRVIVIFFCLVQKRKGTFTGSQCYPNHLHNKVWKNDLHLTQRTTMMF